MDNEILSHLSLVKVSFGFLPFVHEAMYVHSFSCWAYWSSALVDTLSRGAEPLPATFLPPPTPTYHYPHLRFVSHHHQKEQGRDSSKTTCSTQLNLWHVKNNT